jgi:hypothetical protein
MSSAIVLGAISAGSAVYSASQQSKAAKAQAAAAAGMSTGQPYEPVDIFQIGKKAAKFNATTGKRMAMSTASDFNQQAVTDVEAAMAKLFGGGDAYSKQREGSNQVVLDHLAGRLSASTRADVGRKLLATGVSDLGGGAADDAMTGYLGLTQEGLASQGIQEYSSLYKGYRDSVKLVNPADIFQFFGIQPSTAISAEISQAQSVAGGALSQAALINGQQAAIGQASQNEANRNSETAAQLTQIAASSYRAYQNRDTGLGSNGFYNSYAAAQKAAPYAAGYSTNGGGYTPKAERAT